MKNKFLLLTIILLSTSIFCQESAENLNTQGIEFAKKGELEKAFNLFESAIKIYPNFPDAYSNRANVYRIQKKYNLAINDYSKSIELKPNLDVIYSRANTFKDNDDFRNAIKDYTTIADNNPSFSSIFFDRAYAYIMLENYIEAKKDLESQLQVDPTDFKSLANLIGVKKELKLYQEGLADYEKIIKEFPNQPDLHKIYNNRANLYQEMKDYKKALLDADKAIEIKDDYDIGYLTRSEIYMKLGNEKKACQDLKKALKLGVEKNEHFKSDKEFEDLKKLCE
ncbi:MAG: tetratricopeptide repeat protein [Flavobacteriaceae bacterium]|jgi:tetratricopeptide (TPR) repeat protein|nr:tetratricopeptide repeat protein [Flavobacteriaceae bacterium]